MEVWAIEGDIEIYFGETIKRSCPGTQWGYRTGPKSYVSLNRPIITGLSVPLDPRLPVGTLAIKVAKGEHDPLSLYETFLTWTHGEES